MLTLPIRGAKKLHIQAGKSLVCSDLEQILSRVKTGERTLYLRMLEAAIYIYSRFDEVPLFVISDL